MDQAGNLYGTTEYGGHAVDGEADGGVVFELTPNMDRTWSENLLYTFCSVKNCSDGYYPRHGLTFDQAGNLYGTTYWGGHPDGWGVVFKLAPNSKGGWRETVVHEFLDRPGAQPLGVLTFDPEGNLYGTTSGDNKTTFGSVFEITP